MLVFFDIVVAKFCPRNARANLAIDIHSTLSAGGQGGNQVMYMANNENEKVANFSLPTVVFFGCVCGLHAV